MERYYNEVVFLKDLINDNKNLIKETKKQITSILKIMRSIGINLNTGLSDDIYTGNIGINDEETKIKYLLSNKSTIREKTVAISNIIKRIENARILYIYIMKNKDKPNMRKIYNRIQTVTKIKHPERLDINDDKIVLLWCPLLYSFPGYIFKKSNTTLDPNKIISKTLNKKYLIEELSTKEKEFLRYKGIDIDDDIIEIETGFDKYKNTKLNFFNYNDNCYIAGISGHAIIHFTIGMIFNIDYKYILLAQMITMTPIHHSMMEICWAANDMGIMKILENKKQMFRELKRLFIKNIK
jgi:hypothetical protein